MTENKITIAGIFGLLAGFVTKMAGAGWSGVVGAGLGGIGSIFIWNFVIKYLNRSADSKDHQNASKDAAETAIDIKNQADAAQKSMDELRRSSPPVAAPKDPEKPPTIPVTTKPTLPDNPNGVLSMPDSVISGQKFEITYSGEGIKDSHLIVFAERSHFVVTLQWDNTRNVCAGFGSLGEVRDGTRTLGIQFPNGWLEKKISIKPKT